MPEAQGRSLGEIVMLAFLILAIAVGLPVACGAVCGLAERGYEIGRGR